MYYDDDADLSILDGKTVAIIGFGSQGHAHALNLKDSGVDVVVGLRPGSSSVAKAEADGLVVLPVPEAASRGDVVTILVPDEKHGEVWETEVRAGYETLVGAGYDPKLAYFECLHELKLIVDLMYEKGITGMRYSISNTAEYGDLTRGNRVIGEPTREAPPGRVGNRRRRHRVAEGPDGPARPRLRVRLAAGTRRRGAATRRHLLL